MLLGQPLSSQFALHGLRSFDMGIVKTSGFLDFSPVKGSCTGIPTEQAHLRKSSKPPRQTPEKWTILSLAFRDAPSLCTVDTVRAETITELVPERVSSVIFKTSFRFQQLALNEEHDLKMTGNDN